MATKKKAKKKSTKRKKSARGKVARTKKRTQKRKTPKKLAKKKSSSPSKAAAKKKGQGRSATAFSRQAQAPRSGEESGDLQGLSNVESADSESVDELIEEGNAFEAGVVSGVEDADLADEREVHTREVPEDDVPGEYLDKD